MLRRPGAEADYTPERVAEAEVRLAALDAEAVARIRAEPDRRLPATEVKYDRPGSGRRWRPMTESPLPDLAENHSYFLRAVVPVAADVGVNLCIHPDDPAFRCSACRGGFRCE